MKTCITFLEGRIKTNDLEITFDENYEYKIKTLQAHNEYIPDDLLNNYLIYHNPRPFKSNVQNSVFHNYSGHVFVSHKSRDLNENDLNYFKEYSDEVFRKGKRLYTESMKKPKKVQIKTMSALKIHN